VHTADAAHVFTVLVLRTVRCGLQACRAPQMSEVARTLAGKHLTDSRKDCGGHTRAPSPASVPAKTADPTGQATRRPKRVVKVLEWGRGPRATTLALATCGQVPLGQAPHLFAILKDWADDRMNDTQLRSDSKSRRHQYGSPRVDSSQRLTTCSCNVRQLQGDVSHMPKYRAWSTKVRDEVSQ
jgi:hypothetical protein